MAVYSRIRSQITTTPSYPNGLVVTGGMSIGTNIDADVPLKVGTVTATGQIGLNLTSNTGAHLQLTDIGNVDMSLGVLDGQSALSFHTGRNRQSNGTELMRLTSSGNVGIGTSTPQSLLDLKSFLIGRFTFTAKTFAAGAWYRFLTLPGGYGSALTVYLRQPMGHGILEISIGKATYGSGNTGVVAEVKRKGAYHYNYNISQIRIVDMGTNGDTHLEAYFPAATTDTLDMSWHGLVPTNLAAVPVDMTAGSTTGAGTTKTMVVSDGATASTFQTLLGISTLTTDPLYVKSDGKIGLGTQTPSQKLTITDGNFLISKSSFGGNLLWTQGSTSPQSGVFTWGDGTGWRMDFGTSSSNKLSIYDNATTSIEISDRFYVKNQPIYLYNNVGGIQQTDSGGTARWMMRFDASNQRIFGDLSAGSGNATYIQSNSNVYLQSGTAPGQAYLNNGGDFITGREFITSTPNGLRISTLILRNDGENCYFLFGTAGTAGDNWNSLRPLRINNASGWVLIGGEASALTSPLSVGGAVTFAAISISTSTTLGSTHTHVFASGTITITLPTAVGISGRTYWIKRTGTGTITIATTSSQTIDGAASLSISAQYDSYTLVSDGANWYIM